VRERNRCPGRYKRSIRDHRSGWEQLSVLHTPFQHSTLVFGILILLCPDILVTAEDMQILTNSDCFYKKGVTPDTPGGVEVPFDRIRLFYNPQTGKVGSARWCVMAAGHVELEYSSICALFYTARIGNSHIDFLHFQMRIQPSGTYTIVQ
jgi:hypothetical protein